MTARFTKVSTVPTGVEALLAWHARPGAFERLVPPWQSVKVLEWTGLPLGPGRLTMRVKVGPFPVRWVVDVEPLEPGWSFVDRQLSGPFRVWQHQHRFDQLDTEVAGLCDDVHYALPFGWFGAPGAFLARCEVARLFGYRHRVTVGDLRWHRQYGGRRMRIAVTGATGLVGSALLSFLDSGGHDVVGLRRGTGMPDGSPSWDPAGGRVFTGDAPVDAFVHLAGENIAGGRWTEERKRRIRDSRVNGTRRLAEALASFENRPKTLVVASAVGFYGDRGDEGLTESSPAGPGFLPEVCQAWEAAAAPAREAGIRVVHLRIGIVLTPAGGALGQMLLPFKMGVGGVIGTGKQHMSWIALDDVLGSVLHALVTEDLEGPVNVTAPHAATNAEFTKTLGRVLGRPTVIPMPAFGARLAFGEMADALLLSGAKVEPARLQDTGFQFAYPNLEGALRHLLGRS